MLENVLTVAGTVPELAQELDQLGVNSVYAHVETGLLPGLPDDDLHFLFGFGHHLFYAGRMNPPVRDQLLQSHSGDFPPDGIIAREYNRLRRVVHDHIDSSGGFEGTDVSSFSSDYAPLHLLVGKIDYRYG